MWKGLVWTITYLLSIYAVIIACFWAMGNIESTIISCGIALLGVLFVARQMRGLENIVHFGSHSNFSRQRKLNDFVTNLLAAWPMMQDVSRYRIFHLAHHGDYGSHTDPCKARLESIGVDCKNLETNTQLLLLIARWMPSYVREYYTEVKSNGTQTMLFVAWHVVSSLMIALLISLDTALFALSAWFFVMFAILPFVRSIAEFSEHDYERGDTVSETTFNNLGLFDYLLFHPAGDAWHALHHLHPTVAWWQQGAAHRYLMKHDDAYRNALHRDSLLQDIANLPGCKPQARSVQNDNLQVNVQLQPIAP